MKVPLNGPIPEPPPELWEQDPEEAQRWQNGHDAQTGFLDSQALAPGFFAATGTGKTEKGAEKVIRTCFGAGCDALIVTPDYKQSRRGPQEKYIPLLTPIAVDPKKPYNHNDQVILAYNSRGTISKYWFATGMTSNNLWGSEVGIAHLDEVCLMEPEVQEPGDSVIFKAVGTRIRGHEKIPYPYVNQIVVTGTPETTDHWTFKVWGDEDRKDPEDTPWWHMTIWENPFRSPESVKIAQLTTRGNVQEERRLLHGEWIEQREGLIFNKDWFPRYDERPDIFAVVASWDTAGSTKEWAAYTVGEFWGITRQQPPHYYLLNMVKDKVEYGPMKAMIRDTARYQNVNVTLIEDKGSGQPAIQELVSEGLRVVAFNPGSADKQYRASQAAIAAFEGRIHLPSEQYALEHGLVWLPDFEGEVFRVPYVLNWDATDAMSQFLLWAEELRHTGAPPRRISTRVTYHKRDMRSLSHVG